MTEAQARARLQKLLAITLDRGAAPGEQANATRAIGLILQEHPSLRDMITSAQGLKMPPAETSGTFWQGVLVGAGVAVGTLGLLVLRSLFGHGRGGDS